MSDNYSSDVGEVLLREQLEEQEAVIKQLLEALDKMIARHQDCTECNGHVKIPGGYQHTKNCAIGQALAAAKPETGSIEDVKVHDRALTEIELADLMTEEGKQSKTVDLGASRVAAIYKVPPLDDGYVKAGFDCPECNEHVEMLVFHSVAGIEHETCSCSLWLRFLAIDSDKQEKVIIIRQSIGVE
jgi:hypothetical protein